MNILRLLLLSSCLALSSTAWSQAKDPATKAKERTEQMVRDLGLDIERKAQVEALNRIHYRKLAEIKASGDEPDTKKAQSKKAKKVHRAALQRVLTPAQFKRMEVLEAERKAAKKSAKKKEGGPGT
jgi:hypothetical protein